MPNGGNNTVSFPLQIIALIPLAFLIAVIYVLWAIQPLPSDDWSFLQTTFHFPERGQELRYIFGKSFFSASPISFYKPATLLTAIFVVGLPWTAYLRQRITLRVGLVLLIVLGFPYLGLVGPWNLAAADYTVAAVWMALWYFIYRAFNKSTKQWYWAPVLAIATFFTAVWHEVWLVTFSMITAFLILEDYLSYKRIGRITKEQCAGISVALAYILAVLYYTHGGPEKFVNERTLSPGSFESAFTWANFLKTLLWGTKENLVLIKDCLPIFIILGFMKLKERQPNRLEPDFKFFLVASLGVILFMYVIFFLVGPIHWRARWLCAFILAVTFYAAPRPFLTGALEKLKLQKYLPFLVSLSVFWLLWNAYFTYYYTNVDVAGWLKYRQMVINRDPIVLERLCCRTLPVGRPKGELYYLDHEWGVQDNRYRYFFPPKLATVVPRVKAYWGTTASNASRRISEKNVIPR